MVSNNCHLHILRQPQWSLAFWDGPSETLCWSSVIATLSMQTLVVFHPAIVQIEEASHACTSCSSEVWWYRDGHRSMWRIRTVDNRVVLALWKLNIQKIWVVYTDSFFNIVWIYIDRRPLNQAIAIDQHYRYCRPIHSEYWILCLSRLW